MFENQFTSVTVIRMVTAWIATTAFIGVILAVFVFLACSRQTL